MNSITIFCASSDGLLPIYKKTAFLLGQTLAKQSIKIIYGGAKVGLMGAVADGGLSFGGEVIGVIPIFLQEKEIAHESLTQLFVVDTMHERKEKMHQLCEGVIALPGGYGTLEELFEMLTWAQIGIHNKPIGVLNTNGYYNHLIQLLDHMVEQKLLKSENREMVLISDDIETLLNEMRLYKPKQASKWIKN